MIRVALIIPTMDLGGAEKQLALLAVGLPKSEFDVHVFLLTRDGPRSESVRAAGIPVTVIGKAFNADPRALLRLRGALKKFSPDIVHTWIFAANSFGRVAAWMAGVPVVLASERCVDPWKRAWHHWIDRRLADRTLRITTNSTGVRDFYQLHGIAAEKFEIIPNGIPDAPPTAVTRTQAASRLGIDPDRKWIFAIGRLWPQKRYRDLIWAAELIGNLRRDLTLVIVGDGPMQAELIRHRDAVTTSDRVRFVGRRDDVDQWLPHGDLFWIGSEYEGQSNSVIEAMQAGLPVVASDIAGNRDLVIDGETGFLVPLGDTAHFARQSQKILSAPELANELGGNAARRIADHFSVQSMVNSHADLYRRMLLESRSS